MNASWKNLNADAKLKERIVYLTQNGTTKAECFELVRCYLALDFIETRQALKLHQSIMNRP